MTQQISSIVNMSKTIVEPFMLIYVFPISCGKVNQNNITIFRKDVAILKISLFYL